MGYAIKKTIRNYLGHQISQSQSKKLQYLLMVSFGTGITGKFRKISLNQIELIGLQRLKRILNVISEMTNY